MSIHRGWVVALGLASVTFFVATDASADPVDNPGRHAWYTSGSAQILADDGTIIATDYLRVGEFLTDIEPDGTIRTAIGTWGGDVLLDKDGNPFPLPPDPVHPPDVLRMAVRVVQGTGHINAIPGRETFELSLLLELRFQGPQWSCTTRVSGTFGGQYSRRPTTQGVFEVGGVTGHIPPIGDCDGHDAFINKTMRLGKARFAFKPGVGESIFEGPRGS